MSLGAEGELSEACAEGEKASGGGQVMRAASLIVLNVENSSSEEETVQEAVVRYAWK